MWTSSKRPDSAGPAGSPAPTVAIVGSPDDLDALAELRDAYARHHIGQVPVATQQVPTPRTLGELASTVDAVMLTYPSNRAPRTVVPWPAVVTDEGRRVPIGLVPSTPGSLEQFANTAAAVHDRAAITGDRSTSIALLAQRSRRYVDLAGRIRRLLDDHCYPAESVFWWTAEEIGRDDVMRGLGSGLGIAVYVGHGRPSGWVGYAGVRARHFSDVANACGLIVSLACQTLSRRRIGLSFGEQLVTQGAAAATIGAVSATRHVANARWSLRIVDALAAGASSAGALLAAAEPDMDVGRCYRLIGDPMAPLIDAHGARAAARALTDDVVYEPDFRADLEGVAR